VANGDIDTPAKARAVLLATGADAVMIGRAAQGRPWVFGEIAHFLAHGTLRAPPLTRDVQRWLLEHLHDHHGLHGEVGGLRSARKHIGWAVRALPGGEAFRAVMNGIDDAAAQRRAVQAYFDALAERHPRLPQAAAANDEPGAATHDPHAIAIAA
ncbi:MAG: tRNA-dihydrouridine synthase, partial [Burkholderiales bacterium]|nr:tRNA-dihydrouridine synthase [Burkholderiales bacterium]